MLESPFFCSILCLLNTRTCKRLLPVAVWAWKGGGCFLGLEAVVASLDCSHCRPQIDEDEANAQDEAMRRYKRNVAILSELFDGQGPAELADAEVMHNGAKGVVKMGDEDGALASWLIVVFMAK